VSINPTGNPGLATGGTGDVLAGCIGALVAQGYEVFAAAQLGVYLHGLAADLLAADRGEAGLSARDVADALPRAAAALRASL
jgi:NAD(P)H-hydrate epimerase